MVNAKAKFIGSIWRHRKRGTTYRVIGEAQLQTEGQLSDDAKVVVYQSNDDGKWWGRDFKEFAERFEPFDINTPYIEDFITGVASEIAYQRETWGAAHDRSKSAENWFWLVGYLAGKALFSVIKGDREKALHHTISAAAALAQWHAAIIDDKSGSGRGEDADLRPEPALKTINPECPYHRRAPGVHYPGCLCGYDDGASASSL